MGFDRLISVADATAWIDRTLPGPLPAEAVPLGEACGRVLAREVRAGTPAPPFDRATADGYALRAEATLGASLYNPLALATGAQATGMSVRAIRVASGSPLPEGTDAVVPLDLVAEDPAGAGPALIEPVVAGTHVERAADGFGRGALLRSQGHPLAAADLGLLAEAGLAEIEVVRRPHVRLVVTGRNLAPPGQALPAGAVYDADMPMLRALVARDGGIAEVAAVDRSSAPAVAAAVAAPLADLVLVVGGSGLGPDDMPVRAALGGPAAAGGDGDGLGIHGIAMRPGSSIGMGRVGGVPVFLLPGLPVSCFWAYEFFAGRAVRRLAGRAAGLPYARRDFLTTRKIVSAIGYTEIWPMRRIPGTGGVEPSAAAAPDGTGGLFAALAEADGFVVVPEESEGVPADTGVAVYLYDDGDDNGARSDSM